MIPVVSQVKSFVHFCSGDSELARETQEDFSKQCPVISQSRSLVHFISGDNKAAENVQKEFLRNAEIHANALPVVAQAKSLVEVVVVGPEKALQTQLTFTDTCAVISQAKSAVQALSGNMKAAKETHDKFMDGPGLLHVGIAAVVIAVVFLPSISRKNYAPGTKRRKSYSGMGLGLANAAYGIYSSVPSSDSDSKVVSSEPGFPKPPKPNDFNVGPSNLQEWSALLRKHYVPHVTIPVEHALVDTEMMDYCPRRRMSV